MTPEQVLQSSGQSFKPASGGGELVTGCPACGKEEHLYINAGTGAWHCKRCGKAGGLWDLAELLGVDGGQRDLTDKAVAMNAALPPNLREWFGRRGIDSLIGLRRYGYDTRRQRISIPYWRGEKVVDIRYRALPGSIEEQLNKEKYLTEEGGMARLYNLDSLKGKGQAILTEGEFDCDLLCAQSGELDNFAIIGCPGASSFKREWVKRFDKCEKVYIVFDPDHAGIVGADRVASLLGEKAIVVDLPEAWGDLTEAFTKQGITTDEFIRRIYLSEEWRQVPASLRRAIPEDGFIKDFLDYSLPQTDAPTEFHVAAALIALATAAGNTKWFRGWGGLAVYPNIWFILAAPPGDFHKSTTIRIAESLIKRTSNGDLKVLPNSFSREALYDCLQENPSGTFFIDEFTAFLKTLNREYNQGVMEDLATMFENPYPTLRYTRGGGKKKLEEVCINKIAATVLEWFLETIRSHELRGGYLTRFLFVPCNRKTREIDYPPPPDILQGNLLVRHLEEIQKVKQEIQIDQIKGLYSEFLRVHRKLPVEADLQGFYSRIGTYILKLAILYELSFNPKASVVTEKAWGYARNMTNWLRDTVTNLVTEEMAFDPYQKARKRVLDIIKQTPGIPHHILMQRIRKKSKELQEIVGGLREEQNIRIQIERSGKQGRPLTRYYPV